MTIRPFSEIREAMRRQEKMRELAEELQAVEKERQAGVRGYSIEEVAGMMRQTIVENTVNDN